MEKKLFSVKRVNEIIVNEGIGYAIEGYMSEDDIADKELKKLWKKARISLENLREYIKEHEDNDE